MAHLASPSPRPHDHDLASHDHSTTSPAHPPTELPAVPGLCALPPETLHTRLDRSSNAPLTSASPPALGWSPTTTMRSSSDYDLEKSALESPWQRALLQKDTPARTKPDSDYEKRLAAAPPSPRSSRGAMSWTPSDASLDHHTHDPTRMPSREALKLLLFLSGPCVALSLANMLWALLSLLLALLSQPLRLCASRPPFARQLCHLQGPALCLQLRAIHTPLPPGVHAADGVFSAFWLVVVHLTAPLLSLGLALVAWVVAVYWLLAKMVDDPSGIDRRDDGLEAVLGLRRWWESWLLRAVNAFDELRPRVFS